MTKTEILPLGTVAGAVLGGVIGTITFAASIGATMAFDWVWDNKEEISKNISNTFNDVKEKGKQVFNNIIDSAKGFIGGGNLGSIYG